MNTCKYCGKDHSHIGATIIPSCVDVKIAALEAKIKNAAALIRQIKCDCAPCDWKGCERCKALKLLTD